MNVLNQKTWNLAQMFRIFTRYVFEAPLSVLEASSLLGLAATSFANLDLGIFRCPPSPLEAPQVASGWRWEPSTVWGSFRCFWSFCPLARLTFFLSMKLQHNKPVWASNGTSHIPLMQHWNVLCFECLWVNNIGAITSWRSCEVETSLQCRQGHNHTNRTCSGRDAACMHKVLFKTIWLSSKSSFHNIFLCLCLLREALKLWFFCVFMCSEVLKVEFTKANIHLFVCKKSFHGHIDLPAWVLRKLCISSVSEASHLTGKYKKCHGNN